MKRSHTIIIGSIAILAMLLIFGYSSIDRLLHLDNYKTEILLQLQRSLNRQVLYGKGEFTLMKGPAFSFHNVVIKEKDGATDFLNAERVDLRLSIWHLLKKNIVLTEVALKKPTINLIRYRSGEFNISDIFSTREPGGSLNVKDIWLSQSTIRFMDQAAAPEALTTTLSDADLVLDHLTRGKKTTFKFSGTLQDPTGKSSITCGGTARLPTQGQPWTTTDINAKVLAKGLQPGYFWPYYARYLPFQKISGRFNLNVSFKGKPTAFASSGEISTVGLRFDYPQVFHAVLTPKKLNINYDLERTPTSVKVKSLALTVDALKVKGSCDILDINTKDPRIVAKATTSPFRLEEFRGYIPYGIIVKHTADYIEQHIVGGTYRLDEGRLEGLVSQIAHMGVGNNYKVLHIRGRVEQGLVTYGPKVPTFNSIKGQLEMVGKDFILSGMTAKFGNSPFALDGRITELYDPLPPCTYPFTMTMKPTQPEVAWLLGQSWGKKLTLSGDSILKMSGAGASSSYNLAGTWDLTQAAYNYPDLVRKPVGRSNTAVFKGTINSEEMKLTSLHYSLGPMALSLAAEYRYSGKPWLGLEIRTNRFALHEIAPMIPMAERYQMAGTIQTALKGEAPSGAPLDLSWKGSVSMAGCSFKPSEQIKLVSAVTGNVTFAGTTLESSQITARLGSSSINGKGTLKGFSTPSLQLTFFSPLLDPADLGLKTPQKGMKISRLAGTISIKENLLHIEGVSGQLNNTILSVKGSVQEFRSAPRIDISVSSPHLEVEDILALTSIEREKPAQSPSASPVIRATLAAETGKVRGIPFERLKGVVMYDNSILYLQPVEAILAGGRLNGTARLDLGTEGLARRFQTSYKLEKVSAEKLIKALGIKKQEIKGTLTLQGELTAKGVAVADLKRTALGSAKLRIEEGSLRRLATLSKIFSILNLSQLLKFQLPDMVSGGMPFNEIHGSFSIKDGILSTNDLYVDSDAINISAVGSINLANDEIDATIGVKPLQTIDKVVSHIPIVGWILTGKEKSLVTAYFEAKGKVDDPVVNAIPVKGMAKGVLNIFRRIFELPVRMVTDTGEVVIGK